MKRIEFKDGILRLRGWPSVVFKLTALTLYALFLLAAAHSLYALVR